MEISFEKCNPRVGTYMQLLNFIKGRIDFPMKLEDIREFENLNKINVKLIVRYINSYSDEDTSSPIYYYRNMNEQYYKKVSY